jgi:hypothetical protein
VVVAVLVLQALAVERGAPRGAADQEPARARVAGRPRQVTDALEAEDGVVDVEGDHRHAVVEYDVAAAIQEEKAPGSLMPSWRIWPFLSSL